MPNTATRYVVKDEHTLGYLQEGSPYMGVLQGSVLKGGHDWKNGPVSTFGATAVTALKNGTAAPADADSLVQAALTMTKGATGIAAATEDGLTSEARSALFADVKNIVTGKTTAEQAIDACLAVK